MFVLGNNFDHASLKVIVPLEQVVAPLQMLMNWLEI